MPGTGCARTSATIKARILVAITKVRIVCAGRRGLRMNMFLRIDKKDDYLVRDAGLRATIRNETRRPGWYVSETRKLPTLGL